MNIKNAINFMNIAIRTLLKLVKMNPLPSSSQGRHFWNKTGYTLSKCGMKVTGQLKRKFFFGCHNGT